MNPGPQVPEPIKEDSSAALGVLGGAEPGEPFYRCPAGHTAKLTEVGSYQECPCGQPWGANEVVEPEPFGARLATKQRIKVLQAELVSARELLAEEREALRRIRDFKDEHPHHHHLAVADDMADIAREALAVPDRGRKDIDG